MMHNETKINSTMRHIKIPSACKYSDWLWRVLNSRQFKLKAFFFLSEQNEALNFLLFLGKFYIQMFDSSKWRAKAFDKVFALSQVMSVSNSLLNRVRAAGFRSTVFSVWERSEMEMSIWLTSSWLNGNHVMTVLWPASWRAGVWDLKLCEDRTRRAILFLKSLVAMPNVPGTAKVCYYPCPNWLPCFAGIIF